MTTTQAPALPIFRDAICREEINIKFKFQSEDETLIVCGTVCTSEEFELTIHNSGTL